MRPHNRRLVTHRAAMIDNMTRYKWLLIIIEHTIVTTTMETRSGVARLFRQGGKCNRQMCETSMAIQRHASIEICLTLCSVKRYFITFFNLKIDDWNNWMGGETNPPQFPPWGRHCKHALLPHEKLSRHIWWISPSRVSNSFDSTAFDTCFCQKTLPNNVKSCFYQRKKVQ